MSSPQGVAETVWNHFGKVLLVVGLVVLAIGVHSALIKDSVTENSVEVEATVEEAWVEEHGYGRNAEYEPHVTYRYTYEGETYTSSSLHPGSDKERYDDRSDAANVADYAAGERITAHVLPDDPGTAYLRKHPAQTGIGFEATFVVGILFVVVGGLSMVGDD